MMNSQSTTQRIHSLRVNGRIEPVGIPARAPRLSWSSTDVSGPYVVTVSGRAQGSDGEAANSVIWSTTSERPWVTYDGPALRSRARYTWTVSAVGEVDSSEATSVWEVGLAANAEWTGDWIHGWAEEFRHESFDPCPLLRREFELGADDGASGRLYITALGLYRVWVNGVEVTADDLYRPGWTDYRQRLYHQTYAVDHLLRSGANVVAVTLAKGWYAGRLGLLREPGYYGDRPALLAQLEVGERVVVATDTGWRTSTGAITGTDLLRGESQDLRREPHGWNTVGFDDAAWPLAVPADVEANVMPQPHDPIVQFAEVPGRLVHEHARGPLVFDFGQNLVGWTRITGCLTPNIETIVRHGEILTPDNLVYRDNLRGAFQEDRFVGSTDEPVTVEPTFTMHGFRYAEVWGLPSTTPHGKFKMTEGTSVSAVAVTGLGSPVGSFDCSNPALTRLASNIEWTVRDNFLEAATDCPQRDERHGWLGDAGVISPTAAYFFDISAFLSKFAVDAADGQGDDGELRNYAPAVPPAVGNYGAPGWSDGFIRMLHVMVQRYGDIANAEPLFPTAQRFLDHVDRHNPDGIRRNAVGSNFGDWLSLPAHGDPARHPGFEYTGSYSTTHLPLVGTAHTYRSLVQASELATWFGLDKVADEYGVRAAEVRAAYRREFVRADAEIAPATQTAYAQAIGYGLLDDDEVRVAADRLRAAVEDIGYITTGIHGVEHILPVLAANGHADFAAELLLRDEMPSWLYMVEQGGTTIWEKWKAITPDGTLATAEMNSFNHCALGAVGRFLFEGIGGIDATTLTWTGEVEVRPVYAAGLDWARCSYDSPVGTVTSRWERSALGIEHQLEVPGGAEAIVEVPSGSQLRLGATSVAGGHHRFGAGDHRFVVSEGG